MGYPEGVSILYEAGRLCNFSRARLAMRSTSTFQSSTRQADFATGQGGPLPGPRGPVSILYEAGRLCNATGGTVSPLTTRFQSSTRQADFATNMGAGKPVVPHVSFNPLRGRQTLQREWAPVDLAYATRFQSSTRQADFATHTGGCWPWEGSMFQSSTRQADFATLWVVEGHIGSGGVSILYEAGRLCNCLVLHRPLRGADVSILYEAGRLCNLEVLDELNVGLAFQSSTGQADFATRPPCPIGRPPAGFNPLRGRQTLQPECHPHRGHRARVSILYEAGRLCNPDTSLAIFPYTLLFQSSTRQADFATPGGLSLA